LLAPRLPLGASPRPRAASWLCSCSVFRLRNFPDIVPHLYQSFDGHRCKIAYGGTCATTRSRSPPRLFSPFSHELRSPLSKRNHTPHEYAAQRTKEPLINLRIMAHCAFDSRGTAWTGS
jgi:hypothetical protein